MNKLVQPLIRALLITAIVSCCNLGVLCQPASIAFHPASPSVLGTWKGESICVGNRPACKDEVVVFRFEAIAGKPGVVSLLADKIIEGKRVPMGKLEFRHDEEKGELLCEFSNTRTHGLWQYKMTGDSMEGTLVLLPDREVVRRVKLKRIAEGEVPAAPAREMYEGA